MKEVALMIFLIWDFWPKMLRFSQVKNNLDLSIDVKNSLHAMLNTGIPESKKNTSVNYFSCYSISE